MNLDPARAQTRHALVVGVNEYVVADAEATGRGTDRGWTNLEGAVNDAETMAALMTTRFGFPTENVTVLLDQEASRQGILDAIRTELIESVSPGDQVVFFYAGHGSQVVNRASQEADSLDETIVPADAQLGAQDIRDKEMRRLFNEVLDAGAEVTLIFDSCHSGSVTRGISPGKSRAIRRSPTPIEDASAMPPPPQEHPGALVISAAQDDEKAKEMRDEAATRGAFTWALAQTLRQAPTDLPANLLFQRVRALMRSHGFSQEPVLEGSEVRRNRPLFGSEDSGGYTGTTVAVLDTDGASITLQGGLALGLRPGTELRKLYDSDEGPADRGEHARLRITEAAGLSRASATVVQGDPADVSGGDLFVVERWVSDAAAPLQVWMPPAMEAEAVMRVRPVLDALRASTAWRWVDDPTQTAPTHVVTWNGAAWVLNGPEGAIETLGTTLDPSAVEQAVHPMGDAALFVNLPPPRDLASALAVDLDDLSHPVRQVDAPEQADYHLGGTFQRGAPAYHWFYRAATDGPVAATPPRVTRRQPAANVDRASSILADYVRRIDRVWGWLRLEAPPEVAAFPYRIGGFVDVQSGARLSPEDTLRWRRDYRLMLKAEPEALRTAQRSFDAGLVDRYLYVFAMDIEGNGTLLFGGGNVENSINFFDDVPDPEEILLPREGGSLFTSYPTRRGELPEEVDTFVLITTSEPLPNPDDLLTFSGVPSRTVGTQAAPKSGLSRLLFETGHGTRGTAPPVPVDWSIQRVPMVSAR